MNTFQNTHPLTNLQIELLKMYSLHISDSQLQDIRQILARYFADNVTDEMDKLWNEKGWNENTMIDWVNEHFRTHKDLKL